jgi:hypothetical protein
MDEQPLNVDASILVIPSGMITEGKEAQLMNACSAIDVNVEGSSIEVKLSQ